MCILAENYILLKKISKKSICKNILFSEENILNLSIKTKCKNNEVRWVTT